MFLRMLLVAMQQCSCNFFELVSIRGLEVFGRQYPVG